jgi:hypothetical protein
MYNMKEQPVNGKRAMNPHQRYDAYWIPGLNADVDDDKALETGFRWLASVSCDGQRIYVMNARDMLTTRHAARFTTRFILATPQTRNDRITRSRNAVLAVWPVQRTLDFADGLALGGSLCVIPGTIDDMKPWVARTAAQNLWEPDAPPEAMAKLPEEVRSVLDHIITFDGHNNFIGAGGKENSIRHLRALVRDGYRLDPLDIENYVLASGRIRSHEGAKHIREWYEGILAGKSFRDYAGRRI